MKTRVVFLAFMIIAGCGGTDEQATTPPIHSSLSISFDTPALTVQLASENGATLHVARTGAIEGEAPALSASAVPPGVSVTFGRIDGDDVAVHVSATVDAVQTTSTITIIATIGDLSAEAAMTLTVGPMTVSGQYLAYDGLPLPGIALQLWSHGAAAPLTATTNADGTFLVPGVTPPYDVLFETFDVYLLVVGLTRADPLLVNFESQYVNESGATETIQASGANFPQTTGYASVLAVSCPTGLRGAPVADDGTASVAIYGLVSSPEECTMSVLQHQTTDVFPAGEYAFGAVTAAPGTANIPLEQLTSHNLDVTIDADVGPGNAVLTLYYLADHGPFLEIGETAAPTNPQAMAVPDDQTRVPMTVQLVTLGTGASVTVAKAVGTGAALTISAPDFATYASPQDGATDVTLDTEFAVADVSGVVRGYTFQTPEHPVLVVTAAPSVTRRVLVDHGLTPSTAADQFTNVSVFDGVASVDAFASGVGSARWERTDGIVERRTTATFTPVAE